jgi:two-component system phosphate regulon sensor histidine kinase PhoR
MTSAGADKLVRDPRNWSFQTGADGYYDKDEGHALISAVQALMDDSKAPRHSRNLHLKPLMDFEIMTAISQILDRQLYLDITRLKDLNEQKDAFVANVSHEFGSPLAIIKGFLDLLNDEVPGPVNPEQREAIQIGLKTVKRLSRLTRDLLDISKIEAGKIKLACDVLDMASVMRSVVESFSQESARKKVKVQLQIPPEPVKLNGDEDRLTQVVVNLFSNALKYTPEGGTISLGMEPLGDRVRIWVQDTGPGIPEAQRNKIFDKFERIVLEKEQGTGLGLSIARDLVRLHGGTIWVTADENGTGSKFIFELPVKICSPAPA